MYFKVAKKLIVLMVIILVIVTIFYVFNKDKPTKEYDLSQLPQLMIGDWLFREGNSLDSQVILSISGGKYSHIGMVVQVEPEILIVHATTDDFVDQQNQVLLTPLTQFLQADLAKHFAIKRVEFINIEQQQIIAENLLKEVGKEFVLKARNESHRYCTTILLNEIQRHQLDFSPVWTDVEMPFFRGEYLFPEAFWQYHGVKTIYEQ